MKVVILNDTAPDMHHGCTRVMRLLTEGLLRHGMTIMARSPVHHDWETDQTICDALARADLIVINGEGTLHHGKPTAARLLRVTEVAGDVPVALVNALYQDNPRDWAKWLNRLSYISTRDSRSADAIAAVTGRRPVVVPDLTLSARIGPTSRTAAVVYGDSVKRDVSDALALRAHRHQHPFVPSLSALKRMKGSTALGRRIRGWWMARHMARTLAAHPTMRLCPTEAAYADRIASTSLHVTGRFHGVCYAMAAGVPFLAVASNSWKIEALVADAGLAPWRVTDVDRLDDLMAQGAEAMFAALADLARCP